MNCQTWGPIPGELVDAFPRGRYRSAAQRNEYCSFQSERETAGELRLVVGMVTESEQGARRSRFSRTPRQALSLGALLTVTNLATYALLWHSSRSSVVLLRVLSGSLCILFVTLIVPFSRAKYAGGYVF